MFEIDGQLVMVLVGMLVMCVVIEVGVNVLKFCVIDLFELFGLCWLCFVEIEGWCGYLVLCMMFVEVGMKVCMQLDWLQLLCCNVMELYIFDYLFDCFICFVNGDCELQDMVGVVGLCEVCYGFDGVNYLKDMKDELNLYFMYDLLKCIVCNCCVCVCEEMQGMFVLMIVVCGFELCVVVGESELFMVLECVLCGVCVVVCLMVMLQEKFVVQFGQVEYLVVMICVYCGVGCLFKVEMKGMQVVCMMLYKNGFVNEGYVCVKGCFVWGYVMYKDCIMKLMICEKIIDLWCEVSWEEVFIYVVM